MVPTLTHNNQKCYKELCQSPGGQCISLWKETKLFLKTLSMLTFPDHSLVLTFIYFNLSEMKVRLHKRKIHLHKSTENLWRSISIPSRDEAMDFLEEHKAGRHCCNLARKLKHWAKAFSTHKIATKHFQFKNIFRKIGKQNISNCWMVLWVFDCRLIIQVELSIYLNFPNQFLSRRGPAKVAGCWK